LIFAPIVNSTVKMHQFSQMMMNEYIKENRKIGVIGASENVIDESAPT